jgi:PAS domain S-box-containing protein
MPRVERRDPRSTASRRQTGGGRRRTDFSLEAAVKNSDHNLVLGSVVETVAEGICIVDRKSLVQFANREAERILGVSRQAMIRRTVRDLTKESLGRDGKPMPMSDRPSGLAMERNRPVYDIQLSFLRPDGIRIHLSCNAAPLRDAAGKVTGAVISLRDITEQVLAGEELEAMGHARRHLIDRLVSAQEEERRRIAADMHDDSLQVMAAISLRLARVRQRTKDQATQEAMDELQATVELAATRMRHMLFNLRPPVLDREGVAAALRGYLERMRDDAGVHYRLHNRLVPEPSLEQRTHLFRIAQEALANVRKHAGATRVDVSLDTRSGGSLLTVRDDGKGFTVDGQRRPDSLGLLAMSERAEMMGGWCEVQSAEGEGTRVRVWLPDLARSEPPRLSG